MIVRTIKVTRSRSVSLIFPAATSRSSALALNWGMCSVPHSSTPQGTLRPTRGAIHKPRFIRRIAASHCSQNSKAVVRVTVPWVRLTLRNAQPMDPSWTLLVGCGVNPESIWNA